METISMRPLPWFKTLFRQVKIPPNLLFPWQTTGKILEAPVGLSLNSAKTIHPASYIESYGTFLPSTTVSAAATVKAVRKVKFIPLRYVTGIKRRRVSNKYSSLDLANRAVAKCFARSRYRPEDIDLIICCHIAKLDKEGKVASYEPTTAFEVRRQLGMTNAICFDLNNACAGTFTAIYIADKMIKEGTIRRALICSGEHISPLCHTAQQEIESISDPRLACLTLGDAGAAIILDASNGKRAGFQYSDIKTMAEHSKLCMAGPTRLDHGGIIMHTHSSKISRAGREESFKFTFEKISKKLIPIGADTKIIHHQIATRPPKIFRKMLNSQLPTNLIKRNNVIINVSNVGNTASTSHIVALAAAVSRGTVKNNQEILFVVQASGLTIGVFHYKLDDLPQKIKAIKASNGPSAKSELLPPAKAKRPESLAAPKIAIRQIEVSSGESGNTVNMAAEAALKCLERSSTEKNAVNYLIHCGLYRTDSVEEPSHAALIAGEMGLSHHKTTRPLLCFDVVNGELGWLNACYAASSLIDKEEAPYVFITASECDENKKTSNSTPLNITEMGSAVLLKPAEGTSGFSHFHFQSDIMPADTRQVKLICAGSKSLFEIKTATDYEERLISAIAFVIDQKIASEEINLGNFKYFILPQRSGSFLQKLSTRLSIPMTKVIDVTAEDDRFTSSIPLALSRCIEDTSTQKGDRALILSAASGIQVGMAIYTF